jgi:hypothetical protein
MPALNPLLAFERLAPRLFQSRPTRQWVELRARAALEGVRQARIEKCDLPCQYGQHQSQIGCSAAFPGQRPLAILRPLTEMCRFLVKLL